MKHGAGVVRKCSWVVIPFVPYVAGKAAIASAASAGAGAPAAAVAASPAAGVVDASLFVPGICFVLF